LRRVAGMLLGEAKLINMDMCATIMRMCRQKQWNQEKVPTRPTTFLNNFRILLLDSVNLVQVLVPTFSD